MSEPVVTFKKNDDNLEFTLSGVNVSIANALRRTMISDIPCVVFETYPYENNNCTIKKNTTKLNNEIIKQRLSCVPVHITDLSTPIENYKLVISKKNDSDSIVYVTTEDFKIYDIKNDTYISDADTKKIFPPDPITKRYIDIVRLKQQISQEIEGEELELECKFSISSAKHNGMFNVVSTCTYGNSIDTEKGSIELSKKMKELKKKGLNQDELKIAETDWNILDSQKHFIDDSFDFVVESVGVFKNDELIKGSCEIINKQLEQLSKLFNSGDIKIITDSTTMDNCFDIQLDNHDYTIGKLLEYMFHYEYFVVKKTVNYCGFRKNHPHDKYSIIRIAYNETTEKTSIINHFIDIIEKSIEVFQKISKQF